LWRFATEAKSDVTCLYEWTKFNSTPGIYYEELGLMNQRKSGWKLVIELDVGAIEIRYQQLQDYIKDTEERCVKLTGNIQQTCQNIMRILHKDEAKLTLQLTHLRALYRNPSDRRGLFNAIGMISKTLFGTMDADDAKTVNEQLEMLRNNQKTTQHAVQNQLKILDATIGHTDRLEKTLTYNENLLANTTQKMRAQLARTAQQEDIIEHLMIMITIMNDLSQDIENFIDFLTNTASGLIMTRLLPLEKIIKELKEAATHLTKGLHFPFKIQIENWRTIQKYMTINAYYDRPTIYTTLKFPIIAYPTYKIIKPIPIPIHAHKNIFTFIRTNQPLLAIDKENHHYILLNEQELNKCTQDRTTFTCEQNFPVYHVKTSAPCEVQIYLNTPGQLQNCERRQVLSNTTLWVTLTEAQTWVYSTPESQTITIRCNEKLEDKIIINGTGKIKLNGNCKLTTPDIILTTQQQLYTHYIHTHLPEFNLTLIRDGADNQNIKLSKQAHLEPIIKDPEELTKLSISLEEISESLDNESIFQNKYVIYPLGSGMIIVILASGIGLSLWYVRNKKQKTTNNQISTRIGDAMLY